MASASPLSPDFPRQDFQLALQIVGAAHFDEKKVRALVEAHPSLVNAWWDWGFGDWESPLAAASHTGNRSIALFLLSKGARLDIFAAAMLGMTDAVQAMIAAQPGVQKAWGPHGITLLAHAKAGKAEETVKYLESLGDADNGPPMAPVSEERKKLILGKYDLAGQLIEIRQRTNGILQIAVRGGSPQNFFHRGGDVWFPPGLPTIGFRFEIKEGKAVSFTFENPEPVAVARRID